MKYCETCRATYPTDFTSCPKDQSVLRVASELMQGMVIRDKYQVLEKVGAGGMASVYRVKHLAFNEERAIKVVSSKLADDPSFLRRFKTEAVVTRKLQHPNAVRVDDLDTTDDGRPYIVMEYVQGRNLREVIEHGGPLPVERVLHIVWQVCSALASAHQLGITHRDIKPDNILLVPQPNGRELAKVLDFGIAKVREGAIAGAGGYTATQTGMVVGTPQYISPEQALGKHGDQIDGRADLYSLGIVIYEMLTGELPFQSDTPMGLLMAHIQTPPVPPHQRKPGLGIPPALSQVLMKVLAKDPAQRFQSAGEMLEALQQARPSVAARAAATKVITPTQMAAAAAGAPAAAPPATTPSLIETAPLMGAAAPAASAKPAPAARPARPAPRAIAPAPKSRNWPTYAFAALVVVLLMMIIAGRRQRAAPTATPPATTPAVVTPAEPAVSPPSQAHTEAPPAQTTVPPQTQSLPPQEAGPPTSPAEEEARDTASSEPPPGEEPPAASGTPQQQKAEHIRRLLSKAKDHANHGRYRQSWQALQAVLALDPDNAAALAGLRKLREAGQEPKPKTGQRSLGRRRPE